MSFLAVLRRNELCSIFVLILLAAVVTWFPTWNEPYAEDDYLFLEGVSRPDAPTPLSWFFSEGVMDHHYRPLSDPLFFWLLHRLFGLHPAGYHAILFLVHVMTAFLVAYLSLKLGFDRAMATLAAIIYVTRDFVFPSMIWASGFSDMGSAFFSLASLVFFMRWLDGSLRHDRVLSALFFTLSLVTKETAVVTLGLLALLLVHRHKGKSINIAPAGLWPFILVAVPLTILQIAMARFEEGYGKALYSLSFGRYAFEIWPAYLVWCVAGVKELITQKGMYLFSVIAAYGCMLVIAIRAFMSRSGGGGAVSGWFAIGWFMIALSPALLAPGRVLTNYLVIAAVGPCMWLGSMLVAVTRSKIPVFRSLGAAVVAVVLLLGPTLAWLKDMGTINPGGWVDLERSRKTERALVDLVQKILPHPAPGARILIFGGFDIDLRVLGNPRGLGFGQQQVLASAVRVQYRRSDLEIVSLPSAEKAAPNVIGDVARMLIEKPASTFIISLSGTTRDVTADVIDSVRRGGSIADLRRAILGEISGAS